MPYFSVKNEDLCYTISIMRKEYILVLLIGLLSLFLSCASVETRSENFIADFDPIELESSSISLLNVLGTDVTDKNVQIFFVPRDGRVLLYFRDVMGAQYKLYLEKDARDLFEQSFTLYSSEFEARNLDHRKRVSWDIYGKSQAELEWGLLQITDRSELDLTFGYRFIKDSPYFMLTIPVLISDVNNPEKKLESFPILFSRSQALALLDVISESILDPIIEELRDMQEEIDTTAAEIDEY